MSAESQRDGADDRLVGALGALPDRDLDPARAAHLRRQATVELVRYHRRASQPRGARPGGIYVRVLEPAWVLLFCLAYLGWALVTAASLQG